MSGELSTEDRLRFYRSRLAELGLFDGPNVASHRQRPWGSKLWAGGYLSALEDLAEHPEITDELATKP